MMSRPASPTCRPTSRWDPVASMMSGDVMSAILRRHADSDHGAVGNAVAMDGDRDFRFSPRPNRAAEIRWRPWGEPAFAEARRLGRPVLLSLSAVWCHWCHVMDETSYSDPRVIAAVNEHFVPIRVDNDRHPDVNRRYNMGGWPTTAFLAASGDVLTGGTYLPPDQMLESLARVKAFFDANQAKILALEGERGRATETAPRWPGSPACRWTASRRSTRSRATRTYPATSPPRWRCRSSAASTRSTAASARSPSSRSRTCSASCSPTACCAAPATPSTCPRAAARSCGRRACTRWCARRSRPWRAAGCTTTSQGGFFRYATQRDWSVPHYEKMLEDNARLAWLYLEASLHAGGPRPRRPGAVPAGGRGHHRLPPRHALARRRPGLRRQPGRGRDVLPAGRRRRERTCRRRSSIRPSTWTGTRWRRGRCSGGRPVLGRAGAGRPRPAAARPPVREGAPRRRHGALRARGRRGRRRRAAAGRPGGGGRGAARRLRGHRRAALAAARA